MILLGDCREVLATLPAESVQCCVTSPPYWGLRDYGVEGQLGLEGSPQAYVMNMVDVFHQVRRVLRPDGTLWLNLGDSYAGSWGARGRGDATNAARPDLEQKHGTEAPARHGFPALGIKPKDLVGIPWRVAFALQADGWYLRSDIIWSKPNPMPESVTDRPTKAHEYVFLLTKSERYFYDADAIKEPLTDDRDPSRKINKYGAGHNGPKRSGNKARAYGEDRDRPGSHLGASVPWEDDGTGRNARTVWSISVRPFAESHFATFPPELARRCILAGSKPGDTILDPFNGAGTTGLVAQEHNREYIGIELNPEYIAIAERRLSQNVLPLLDGAA